MQSRVQSGVSQGSVLEPLLFLLFINNLPEVVKKTLYLFADDTKLLAEVKCLQDALALQTDIDEMDKWSKEWLIKFHPNKCHVLTMGKPSKIKHVHAYAIGDSVLERVSSEKDLGVVFDNTLSFEERIVNKVKKANSMVGLIRRSFLHLSPEMFRTLYITFVRPHLEYQQVVWSPKLSANIST